jgi:hypothetical protein
LGGRCPTREARPEGGLAISAASYAAEVDFAASSLGSRDDGAYPTSKFDADKWVKVARLAVAASLMLSAVTVVILLVVTPSNQCPGWHLKNAHSTSLWDDVVMLTAPLNILSCFIAVRWNWLARRVIESMDRPGGMLFGHMTPPAIPATHVMIHMSS